MSPTAPQLVTSRDGPRQSLGERAELGRAARAQTPRSSHAEWVAPPARQDPLALLRAQDATRVAELVPIRYARMAASPFAFFRGSAVVMAADLAEGPASGLHAQLCGDAHLSNFGGFASPERDLLFDLNDFDETHPGPWEWDVKRLAASVEVAGRDRGLPAERRREDVMAAVAGYRATMRRLSDLGELAIWYARVDEQTLVARVAELEVPGAARRFERTVAKARRKDNARAFAKLATTVGGEPRIISDPPLIVPVRELLADTERTELEEQIGALLAAYRASLPDHVARLLDRYRFVDLARKVVGVGSVGTRCWVVLLIGRDTGDPLFLQAKEAGPSVLAPFVPGRGRHRGNEGRRVVEGQRLMQSAGDLFLGWLRTSVPGLPSRDFYLRQLWDWKASADVAAMTTAAITAYGQLCGATLAQAHARSGDAVAIAAYLGRGDRFDRALADFAARYADQNERDHAALVEAIARGEIAAAPEA